MYFLTTRAKKIELDIRELTPEGVAWLMDLDGNQFSEPTNVDQLKKFYVCDLGRRMGGHHFG